MIASLFFAKAVVLAILYNLSPVKVHKKLCLWLGTIISLWAVVSEFVIAFQCSLPSPWQYLNNICTNRVGSDPDDQKILLPGLIDLDRSL